MLDIEIHFYSCAMIQDAEREKEREHEERRARGLGEEQPIL